MILPPLETTDYYYPLLTFPTVISCHYLFAVYICICVYLSSYLGGSASASAGGSGGREKEGSFGGSSGAGVGGGEPAARGVPTLGAGKTMLSTHPSKTHHIPCRPLSHSPTLHTFSPLSLTIHEGRLGKLQLMKSTPFPTTTPSQHPFSLSPTLHTFSPLSLTIYEGRLGKLQLMKSGRVYLVQENEVTGETVRQGPINTTHLPISPANPPPNLLLPV